MFKAPEGFLLLFNVKKQNKLVKTCDGVCTLAVSERLSHGLQPKPLSAPLTKGTMCTNLTFFFLFFFLTMFKVPEGFLLCL